MDSATTASETTLANDLFDSGLSLATQYKACSLNQLEMVPAPGYNNGVTTVQINLNANGNTDTNIRNAAVTALGGGKPSGVDLVMLCVPPGTTGGW
mmetsp:Transcript_8579/g.21477  ORF Transcript_8579/g.21477 Transcript_8579/m.21477 type:complete len:96 (+) Transcript_8579:1143-1430(+)